MRSYIPQLALIVVLAPLFTLEAVAQLYPAVFDKSTLNGSNGFMVPSLTPDVNDAFGTEVRFIGDINNDGIEDMAIANGNATVGAHELAGRAYIIFGSTTAFPPTFDLNSLDGTNGFIVEAIGYDERRGSTLAGPGDINGDGIDDLIVGSSNMQADEMVIYGAASFLPRITVDDIDGNNGFLIDTPGSNQVDKLGDVNGDGINDFIIGTPHFSGQAWIVFGRTDNFPDMVTVSYLDGIWGFRTSSFPGSRPSYKVGGAGDINKDGYNDMLIGNWGHHSDVAGQISYALFGKGTSFDPVVSLTNVDGSDGFLIDNRGGGFLTFVGPLGDINGDGIDDFYSEKNFVFGSEDPFSASLMMDDLDGSNGFIFQKGVHCASPGGDLNQDGLDDFLVVSGDVYIVFGTTDGFSTSFDAAGLNGSNGFLVEGGNSNIGRPVDGGSDVNGDGRSDFIFGDGSSSSVYVVFGGDHLALPLNSGYPQVKEETPSGFTLWVSGQEKGRIYYAVFANGAPATVTHEVIANGTGSILNNSVALNAANTDISEIVSGLEGNTVYDVYLYFGDAAENNGEIYALEDVTTASAQAPFITTWNTENTGNSSNNQITIPTTGTGYNYDIYWEEVSNPANNGSLSGQTGNATISFPTPGIYRVEISGDFPRFYFGGTGGDKQKILSVEQWGDIAWTSMNSAFYGCSNLTVPATDAPDLSRVTDMNGMFQGASSLDQIIGGWDVSNVTKMINVFADATSFNGNISGWDVSNVTEMRGMFKGARNFNQDIGSWDVSNVTNMSQMFMHSWAFNGNIDSWDVGNVRKMTQMFYRASSFNQDIGSWDVGNVSNMVQMFSGAKGFNQPLGSWNVENVQNMVGMFKNSGFNQDISLWNVGKVSNMSEMFYGALSFNQDIGSWNVEKVKNMSNMFFNAASFNQDVSSWNVRKVTDMGDMFNKSGLSSCNYDAILKGWSQLPLQQNVALGAGDTQYSSEVAATRQSIIDNFGWTITDGGEFDLNIKLTIQETSCPGSSDGTLTAEIEIQDGTYKWYNNETDELLASGPTLSGIPAGTYRLEVDFGNGCTYTGITTMEEAEDTEAPTIAFCPGDQILELGETLPDYTALATVSDNCDNAPLITQSPVAGTAFTPGMEVTLTTKDASGNKSTCTFKVNETADTEKPVISCPGDQELACDASEIPDFTAMVSASDNREEVTITQLPVAETVFTDGMTITMTAEDAAGNSNTCTFTVSKAPDTEKPTITFCPREQILEPGQTLPDYTAELTATDNCDGDLEITQSPVAGTAFTAGMTVMLTVTDAGGNSSSCTFAVMEEEHEEVADTEAPVISCLGDQEFGCNISSLPNFRTMITATDNKDTNPVISQYPVAGEVFTEGMIITMTATDASGNSSSCSFTVTEKAFSILCPADQLVHVASDCQAVLPDYTNLLQIAEGCSTADVVISQSPLPGTVITTKTQLVLTAISGSGQTATCTFEVGIAGNTPLEVAAGANASIVRGESRQLEAVASAAGTFSWEPAAGLDNAYIADPVASPEKTTTYTVTFTAENGCSTEDVVTVEVLNMLIPKGFSPDNDGINDNWVIKGIENYPDNEVSIYNRWGDRVFSVKKYDNVNRSFSGRANHLTQIGAGELPEGTYFYTITLSEGKEPLKGFLVLKK